MMRSLFSAVSGLKTHQTKMDVIGNNIANVNTVAFKSTATTFSEIMYQMQRQEKAVSTQGRLVLALPPDPTRFPLHLLVRRRRPETVLIFV